MKNWLRPNTWKRVLVMKLESISKHQIIYISIRQYHVLFLFLSSRLLLSHRVLCVFAVSVNRELDFVKNKLEQVRSELRSLSCDAFVISCYFCYMIIIFTYTLSWSKIIATFFLGSTAHGRALLAAAARVCT